MQTRPAKLVTIVAESVLQDRLMQLVLEEGASGYTVTLCSGQGSRGLRSTTPIDGENFKIEVVASDAIAARLLDRCAAYFPHYALIVWASPIEVGRGEKFSVTGPPAGPDG